MLALILAGGRGLRLVPYTKVLPKPLLPIGDRPVLAILLEGLRRSGVTRAVIALGYLGDLIRTYVGDGSRFGLPVSYLSEREPLGTAGPVHLLEPQREPFLVVNGDILTQLPFSELYSRHLEMGVTATVAAKSYQIKLDYGRLCHDGHLATAWEEKPAWQCLIGIGAYVLGPEAQSECPEGRVEMPGLISRLLSANYRVGIYETSAYWRDIGHLQEYQTLCEDPPDFLRKDAAVEEGANFHRAESGD